MAKHIHADLIKAWADNTSLVIQCRPPRSGRCVTPWHTISSDETILWAADIEYRIKPKAVRYRLYIWKNKDGEFSVESVNSTEEFVPESSFGFVRWLDDWKEFEVTETGEIHGQLR